MVLKFYYMQSHSQLRSMSEEIQLLRLARQTEHPYDSGTSTDADNTWKLDQPSRIGLPNSGPLMDSTGKVHQSELYHLVADFTFLSP
jgi:immunoglobulin-binding protein 1